MSWYISLRQVYSWVVVEDSCVRVCAVWFQKCNKGIDKRFVVVTNIYLTLNSSKGLLFLDLPIVSMIAPLTTRWHRQTVNTFGGWNISTSLFTATCARACCWVWGSKDCAAPVSTWTHQRRASLTAGSFLDSYSPLIFKSDRVMYINVNIIWKLGYLCRLQIHSPRTLC